MKKYWWSLFLVSFLACGTDSTTAPPPEPVAQPQVQSQSVTPTVQQPAVATQPWEGLKVSWNGTTLNVENVGTAADWLNFCVYKGWKVTGSTIAEKLIELPINGKASVKLEEVYSAACGSTIELQLDAIHGACGIAPEGHGGHNYGAVPATLTGVPCPKPSPSPSPSPTPPPPPLTCEDFTKPTFVFPNVLTVVENKTNVVVSWPGVPLVPEVRGGVHSGSVIYGECKPLLPTTLNRTEAIQTVGFDCYQAKYYGDKLQCRAIEQHLYSVLVSPLCDKVEFWNQSIESNDNWIKANVHVRGGSTWVLKLFATSSSNEYPDKPDYTKDTDEKIIICKGEGELKVEYNWKSHSSPYWWAALYENGVRVWLSERISKEQ